jgi:hypothetical protein
MGCCGKNRMTQSELAAEKIPPMQVAPTNAAPGNSRGRALVATQPIARSVSVRYLEQPNIVVRGPATGRRYAFSGTNHIQSVDARDASALLETRFFRRA